MIIYINYIQVHRRMLHDDKRGVGEPLNEPGVDGKSLIIRGHHVVIVDNVENSTIYHRMLGELLMMREYPLFVSDSGDPKDYMQKYMTNVRHHFYNSAVLHFFWSRIKLVVRLLVGVAFQVAIYFNP